MKFKLKIFLYYLTFILFAHLSYSTNIYLAPQTNCLDVFWIEDNHILTKTKDDIINFEKSIYINDDTIATRLWIAEVAAMIYEEMTSDKKGAELLLKICLLQDIGQNLADKQDTSVLYKKLLFDFKTKLGLESTAACAIKDYYLKANPDGKGNFTQQKVFEYIKNLLQNKKILSPEITDELILSVVAHEDRTLNMLKKNGYIINPEIRTVIENHHHFSGVITNPSSIIKNMIASIRLALMYSFSNRNTENTMQQTEDYILSRIQIEQMGEFGENALEASKRLLFRFGENNLYTKILKIRLINSPNSNNNREGDDIYLMKCKKEVNPITHAIFYVTDLCNYRCLVCLNTFDQRKRDPLTLENAKLYLTQLHQKHFKSVTFTGGEPFMHPQFLDILEYAKSLGFHTTVLTNGSLINFDLLPKLETLVNTICIPLESLQADIQGQVRGKVSEDNHAKMMNLIPELAKRKFLLTVSTVATQKNLNELNSIKSFLIKSKVKDWRIEQFVISGRGASNPEPYYISDEDFLNAEKIMNITENERSLIRIRFQQKKFRPGIVILDMEGTLYLGDNQNPLGNIIKDQILFDKIDMQQYELRRGQFGISGNNGIPTAA
ncbi:MAG: radical SAM protein [uncultured bacterium]|nr:MAG: radical SAM protein [uncultured bacterium]